MISDENWNYLCSQHRQPLPSNNKTSYLYKQKALNQDEEGDEDEAEESQINTSDPDNWKETSDSPNKYSTSDIYKQTKKPKYHVETENNICTPEQGFILAQMKAKKNSYKTNGTYTDIQRAWYKTLGYDVKDLGKLSSIATNYQEFVKKIAKNSEDVDDTSTYVKKEDPYTDMTIKFPKVKKEKNLVKFSKVTEKTEDKKTTYEVGDETIDTFENVTWNFDENTGKYKIGPFALKYEKAIEKKSNVAFGQLTDFRVKTDNEENPELDTTEFNFVYENKRAKESEDYDYPDPGEIFYIETEFNEKTTKLLGFEVKYQYLVAGGKYQTIIGDYYEYMWNVKCDPVKDYVTDENGVTQEITTGYEYSLKAVSKQGIKKNAQRLAVVNEAAMWYETAVINIPNNDNGPEDHHASLKLQKQIQYEGRNLDSKEIRRLCGHDLFFNIEVTVHNNGKNKTIPYRIQAGSDIAPTILPEEEWKEGKETPTYEVKEEKRGNEKGIEWKLIDINDESGSSIKNKTCTMKENDISLVTVTNEFENVKSQSLSVVKTVENPVAENQEFFFDVIITLPDGETKDYNRVRVGINQGNTESTGENIWTSEKIYWVGDENPTYIVKEIQNEGDAKKYPGGLSETSKGVLNGKTDVEYFRKENPNGIYKYSVLEIGKDVKEKQVTADKFKFELTVNGISENNGKTETIILNAGEKAGPFIYKWAKENEAPTFVLKENSNNGIKNVKMSCTGADNVFADDENKVITGTLNNAITADHELNDEEIQEKSKEAEKAEAAVVTIVNDMQHHDNAKIKVKKEIKTQEKISKETLEDQKVKFTFKISVEGTFKYKDQYYDKENTLAPITVTLPQDGKWEFTTDKFEWWGETAPTYTVEEVDMPKGWHLANPIEYSDISQDGITSEGHSIIPDKTVEATATNELNTKVLQDLTFAMAGLVWIDKPRDDKNEDKYYGEANGVYDPEWETLEEGAEVTVYRVVSKDGKEISRTVAKAYKDEENNELQFPIITKADGEWRVPRIQVTGFTDEEKEAGYSKDAGYSVKYDVEFVYDGQNYEPTEFLSYKIDKNETVKNEGSNKEKAKEFIKASTSERDKYYRDSMALEVKDDESNSKKIKEVSGKTPIDANGDTTGVVTLADDSLVDINYTSDNAGIEYPTISKLKTTDENGKLLDIFKAKASTSAGGLKFPFDNKYRAAGVDKKIDEEGVKETYHFTATYNYTLHINLGLKEKPEVDIGLCKDLDNAKVFVNEKMYEYDYSGNYDLTEEKTGSLSVKNPEDITKELGLYKSDYYYRAEMYKTDNELWSALDGFYNTMQKNVDETELDVYLTYKVKVQNSSSEYDVVINRLNDYHDHSLTFLTADETKYIKTKTTKAEGEQQVNGIETVDARDGKNYIWIEEKNDDLEHGTIASDGVEYDKMTVGGLNIKLAPGESKELSLVFKVNKKDNDDAKNAIVLGQKCNIAEIGSYTTYKKGTEELAGRIDRDSAPDNINLQGYNDKKWYEDDTFAAPKVKLEFTPVPRTINGLVWEDNSNDKNTENAGYNQEVGNGIKDSGEETIKGLTTDLVEKIIVPTGTEYTEYDFVWPTDKALESLNGKTIEEVVGFDSTIETDDKGDYSFNNVPAGEYVVKYIYGDKKIESQDYSTANYYNGQDYKSTKYKAIVHDRASNLVQPSKYMNLEATSTSEEQFNSAADSEARRLEVIANSREITYDNNAVMASAMSDDELKGKGYSEEDINKLRNELISKDSKYSMYAYTPKLDMNIEYSTLLSNWDTDKTNVKYEYRLNNINCGIEERPITKLTLDKQIEELTLTTSDGTVLMDAKYNIDYKINDNGTVEAIVDLDKANSYGTDNLQALNRDKATDHGFRYINVDSTILEGTTLTAKYRFTVLNTGEVDRTGMLATMDYKNDSTELEKTKNQIIDSLRHYTREGNTLVNNIALGNYVGTIYYAGADVKDISADAVVSSTVRQLVDYVDNDMTFDGMLNSTKDTSWGTVSPEELQKLIKDDIVTSMNGEELNVLDNKEVKYDTENRHNLIVSTDETSEDKTLNNSGFIVDLKPVIAVNSGVEGKDRVSMYLTTTRYMGSDSDDLQVDNIVEIIKYNNRVGRRDELTIAGNQVPAEALKSNPTLMGNTLSIGMEYEHDTSATEVITLSPPTGSGLMTWRLQVIGSIIGGLTIVAGGIVLIKKKVLK